MKFRELNVDRLRRELAKLDLPSTGSKTELQKRLYEDFQRRGINVDNHVFDDEDETEMSALSAKSNTDINALLAAMMEKMQLQNEKLMVKIVADAQEAFRAENKKLIAEVHETSKATTEKLQEIYAKVSKRVDDVDERVTNAEKIVDENYNVIEEKFNSLQCQQPEPVRIIQEVSSRIRTPCFDGSTPPSVFKFQFDAVASRNGWAEEEKALELNLTLKGAAAEILETMPASCRNNYNDVMVALERKFSDEDEIKLTAEEDATCREKQQSLKEFHEFVRSRIKLTSERMKTRYDRAANIEGFQEGQLVLLHNSQWKKRLFSKLKTKWDGSYKVIKRLNNVEFRIQKHYDPRTKMKVVHTKRLASYGRRGCEPIRDEQA